MDNLDELIMDVEKLLALLKEREFGMFTWHEAVHKQFKKVAEYFKQEGE